MVASAPGAELVPAILQERGWRGWTRIERVPAERLGTAPEALGGHNFLT